jgi:hypothetical protein
LHDLKQTLLRHGWPHGRAWKMLSSHRSYRSHRSNQIDSSAPRKYPCALGGKRHIDAQPLLDPKQSLTISHSSTSSACNPRTLTLFYLYMPSPSPIIPIPYHPNTMSQSMIKVKSQPNPSNRKKRQNACIPQYPYVVREPPTEPKQMRLKLQ